jgi:hypothetical protein
MPSRYERRYNPDYKVGRREQALAWARRQDPFEGQEMATALGITLVNAWKVLSRLAAEGAVIRLRPGVYSIGDKR